MSQTLAIEAGKMLMVMFSLKLVAVFTTMTVFLLEGRSSAVSSCCGKALILSSQIFAEAVLRFENFLLG